MCLWYFLKKGSERDLLKDYEGTVLTSTNRIYISKNIRKWSIYCVYKGTSSSVHEKCLIKPKIELKICKNWCAWFSAYLYFWFFKVFSIWNRWKGPIKDCLMAPKAQIHKNVSIVYGRYIKRLVARISDINEDSLLPKTLTNHLFSWHSEAIFGLFCIGIFIMIFSFSVVCLNTYFQILAYFWKKTKPP